MMLNTLFNTLQSVDSQLLFSSVVWCTAVIIALVAFRSCLKSAAHA